MSYENAKLVLSGGVASTPFLHEIFELAGTETPRIVFDGSPCVSQESLDKKQAMWRRVCEDFRIPEPRWIQDDVNGSLSRGKTNTPLDYADVLYVTGGASRKAISQWNEASLTADINDRVPDGHITVAGGSAGAMIWFEVGISDSEFYDVKPGEHWNYKEMEEASFFDSWIIAHSTDKDNLGRDKQAEFSNFLRQRDGEWNYGVGIDTCAALVCMDGIAQVRDITPLSRVGQGLGVNVYLYFDSIRAPRKLSDGDLIPLDQM